MTLNPIKLERGGLPLALEAALCIEGALFECSAEQTGMFTVRDMSTHDDFIEFYVEENAPLKDGAWELLTLLHSQTVGSAIVVRELKACKGARRLGWRVCIARRTEADDE